MKTTKVVLCKRKLKGSVDIYETEKNNVINGKDGDGVICT